MGCALKVAGAAVLVLAACLALGVDPGTLASVVGWTVAVLGVLAVAVAGVESSEVTHVAAALVATFFLAAGAGAAGLAHAAGAPGRAAPVAFLAPALAWYVVVAARRRRALAREIDEPRLRSLATAELIGEVPGSPRPGAVVDLVLARRDARDAILRAVREGSPEARRAAIEVAVLGRESRAARGLGCELARAVLALPSVPEDEKERALVAVWDDADAALVEVLKRLAGGPGLRCAALEVRARSGDASALDDWIADEGLDAARTAGSVSLALGPVRETRARLEALRAAHPEGTPRRARVEALLDALSIFS